MQKNRKELLIEHINTPKKLGVAIRRIRKQQDLNQTQLSKLTNLRQPTISDIENGKGTLDSFIKIIQALKANLVLGTQNSKLAQSKDKNKAQEVLDLLYK